MLRSLAIASLIALPACGQGAETTDNSAPAPTSVSPAEDAPEPRELGQDIIGETGETIGRLKLREGPNGVLLDVVVEAGGLAPGWHGLHFHQVGDCSDVGTFKRSGGHVGKIAGGHGLMNPAGPETGDLPNIHAAPDGSAAMEAFSDRFTLADLTDEDGSAMIMHESRDDHISQPIGGAGARVACAAITS
jgi:superoxide dismutase, Cu-Zn family